MFDPFSARGWSPFLNLVNPFVDIPVASGIRRACDAKETGEGLQLRWDMPGLGKEDVKVYVEENTLVIKGEVQKEAEGEECERRLSTRIDLPEKLYKTGEIKAEMKNGVLKVLIPKVKEEERRDVFHVTVD